MASESIAHLAFDLMDFWLTAQVFYVSEECSNIVLLHDFIAFCLDSSFPARLSIS